MIEMITKNCPPLVTKTSRELSLNNLKNIPNRIRDIKACITELIGSQKTCTLKNNTMAA
jgi:hypothetical protein